ncbi:antirestriction protein ArdA [Acidithrix ferrooxidans]|uniref:Antirestriction protein (ArdA) n=1 Tax=Acidithrix ferrooxidans TaxID=1280514 RepID=A0A0D8HGD2_9ACTN|nr:antirestriction protein ArdA [Acidithrix ferrooxidans]KJF16978.1 antirestriction protein (ArdA) [Acidithrix ferrooxidans]
MEEEPKIEVDGQEQNKTEYLEDQPRIYVASLSDYNDGYLHGTWINASQEPEDIHSAIQDMLTRSPTPGAEEYAIHDYENFGPLKLGEYESIKTVSLLAQGITEHGVAYAHWAALVEDSSPEALGRFEDAYRGHFDSLVDYAGQLFDDFGYNDLIETIVPEHLRSYIRVDIEAFARDLELSGSISTSEGDGGVYVFDEIY